MFERSPLSFAVRQWREDIAAGGARADLALKEGEVVAALALLDRLPPKGRAALASWREGAERRAVIDRVVAALRLRAVRDLSPASGAMTEVAP